MGRDDITLGDALREHRAASGFAPDGGVHERWAVLRVGPIPICIPNLPVRRRAMLRHDLNHVVSGYGHDLVGEAETGAWEFASGCKGYAAAWVLAWCAIVAGVVIAPGRVYSAFVRGRRSENLFGTDLDSVMDQSVDAVRDELGLNQEYRPRFRDLLLFIPIVAVGPVVGTLPVSLSILTSPLWLLQGAHRQKRVAQPMTPHSVGG